MSILLVLLFIALLGFTVGMGLFVRGLAQASETIKRLEHTVDRMEAATKIVAGNLADSISRADSADPIPGLAADSALRSKPAPRKAPRKKTP